MDFISLIRRMFMEGYASSKIEIDVVVVCLLSTLAIALYLFQVYKMMNKNSFYNKDFNISIIIISLITASIILTIQSNIVVSLGMVGALSIVRFRTAIKNPIDLAFLFWSISVGIICGAGFAAIALVSSIVITFVIVLMSRFKSGGAFKLLVINAQDYSKEEDITEIINKAVSYHRVRARNVSKNNFNIAIEIGPCDEKELIRSLMEIDDVINASIVEHDGNITV